MQIVQKFYDGQTTNCAQFFIKSTQKTNYLKAVVVTRSVQTQISPSRFPLRGMLTNRHKNSNNNLVCYVFIAFLRNRINVTDCLFIVSSITAGVCFVLWRFFGQRFVREILYQTGNEITIETIPLKWKKLLLFVCLL